MTFEIIGNIMGGKNHINITRTGHRYPNKNWADWRDGVVAQLMSQRKTGPLTEPALIKIWYRAGDLRRRDAPAVLDSIFHCLERAFIVRDDCLLEDVHLYKTLDRENPGAKIEIYPKGGSDLK